MKRFFITLIVIMALNLAACGSDKNAPDNTEGTNGNPTNQSENTMTGSEQSDITDDQAVNSGGQTDSTKDQMQADMDQLTFKEIDIEISYGKDHEYEAEIDQDEGQPIEVKVEDEVNGVYLKGQEAFDDLYPKVKQLDLTKDSPKEETISQVLKAFGLKDDYKKLEVEIKFKDGSKLDIEDRK
ncbi:YusW family protein [Sporosarcina sp.]|uniref:YusW family protein n=1 Tax=Sporosarcina sp. TaxID=49982 RepID=UPI00261CCF3D|nr:YusW family protein [Sporosarcina sp.]